MSSKYGCDDERLFRNENTKNIEYTLEVISDDYFVVTDYVENDIAVFDNYEDALECYNSNVKARL